MLLALFMVESVSATRYAVSTPRTTDGGPGGRTIYDGSMESRPEQQRPVPKVHPLEVPFVPEDWPVAVPITLFFALMAGIAVANYRIRRRFIPR